MGTPKWRAKYNLKKEPLGIRSSDRGFGGAPAYSAGAYVPCKLPHPMLVDSDH